MTEDEIAEKEIKEYGRYMSGKTLLEYALLPKKYKNNMLKEYGVDDLVESCIKERKEMGFDYEY